MANYRHPEDGGNAEGCPRRWAWEKIAGLARPQHPSAALGEEVHGQLERYLREGVPPDDSTRAGAIADAGLDDLPALASPDLSVERQFKFEDGGVNWSGRKDLEYRDAGIYVVHDHKTTSDFKWAKSKADLRTDPQAIIYAREALRRLPDDVIRLDWLYLATSGKPRAKRVSLRVLRDENSRAMAELVPVGREMVAHRIAGTDPLSLPYNDKACFAYRQRCHYADRCNLASTSSFASYMSSAKDRMGLAQRLAKAQKSTDAAAPVSEEGRGPTLAEKVRAEGVNPPPYEPPAQTTPVEPEVPVQEKIAKVAESLHKAGCNKEQIASALRNQFALEDILTFEGTTFSAPEEAEKPTSASGPKKRGRPVGSKNKTKEEPSVGIDTAAIPQEQDSQVMLKRVDVSTDVPAPAGEQKPAPQGQTAAQDSAAVDQSPEASTAAQVVARLLESAAVDAAPRRGFILLVNSVVLPTYAEGRNTEPIATALFTDIIKDVHAQLRAELDIKHYKMVDYGKGVGVLNEALRQRLVQDPIPDDAFVLVDTRTPEGADCYGTLSEFARLIVRNS